MPHLWDGGTMMMNKYRNERPIDIWQHKCGSALNRGRIKGPIALRTAWSEQTSTIDTAGREE